MTKTVLTIGALAATLLGATVVLAQPRDAGFLEVSSEPRAEIFLDEQPTGLWTPQTIALHPGHHKLTLMRGERRPSNYGFTIEPHQTTRLKIHLAF